MAEDYIGLAIGFILAVPLFVWAWRRFDVTPLARNYDSGPSDEPCWTEQIGTSVDGRLSYGRSGCYHAHLAEMEARARAEGFPTPYSS
jgi:hypothetical protein